jgi:hypothetical protein
LSAQLEAKTDHAPQFSEIVVNNSPEEIMSNIRTNAARGLIELDNHEPVATPLMIVGGGPSLHAFLPTLKAFKPECHVLAINGAYKFLRSHGVKCEHFLMIDSRIDNLVHIEQPSDDTNHLLASQVHPAVFDALSDHRVTMFHMSTATAHEALRGRKQFNFLAAPIGMSSIHAIYAAAALGYRTLLLFGYDFSVSAEGNYAYPQPLNDADYQLDIPLNGKVFRTTLAMARTAEQFGKVIGPIITACNLDVRLYSDGLLSEMIAVATSDAPIATKERDKYEAIWQLDEYRKVSPGLRYVDEALEALKMEPGASIADFGCGTGRCAKWFAERGFVATGVDIAGNCLEESVTFVQAALWDADALPPVDYGFTTDVMEHIPPDQVDATLAAIHRACAKGCYFNIDTIPDSFGVFIGRTLHMTVKPAEWWEAKLRALWPNVERIRLDDPQQAVFVVRK